MNVVADISGLISEDEDTDQVVPPTINATAPESQGRQETLSPTPNVQNTVRSSIELTVKDLTVSKQRLCDKCGEIDFQLGNQTDWSQPHPRLRNDLCELIPLLFETVLNTEGFPNLYLYILYNIYTKQ